MRVMVWFGVVAVSVVGVWGCDEVKLFGPEVVGVVVKVRLGR